MGSGKLFRHRQRRDHPGQLVRILKRENGSWKIAMEAFARAIIDSPAAPGSSPPPANSK